MNPGRNFETLLFPVMGGLRSEIVVLSQGGGLRVKPGKVEMGQEERRALRMEDLARSREADEARAAKLSHISLV